MIAPFIQQQVCGKEEPAASGLRHLTTLDDKHRQLKKKTAAPTKSPTMAAPTCASFSKICDYDYVNMTNRAGTCCSGV